MALKKLFKKKKNNTKYITIVTFFLLIFITLFYFFIFNKKTNYIVIPADEDIFYIIPKDRGGEKVKNLDKKSLNLMLDKEFVKATNKPKDIFFSIQFYTDNELKDVSIFLNKLNNGDESIYNLKDFFIMVLNTEIGTDYLLLYKSFKTRELAKKYCDNFLSKLDQCLIVDTTKL